MSGSEARRLGLIEAFVAARDQCPSGRVRSLATSALEAVKRDKEAALHEQAYLLLSATHGWRGDRADQVRASLAAFLQETPKRPGEDAASPPAEAPGYSPETKSTQEKSTQEKSTREKSTQKEKSKGG